jgi:hypothetical protein
VLVTVRREFSAAMRIRLHNERLLAELLSFMREAGCIAYHSDAGAIEALPPTRGNAETEEISALLDRWSVSHPEAEPEIV